MSTEGVYFSSNLKHYHSCNLGN